MQIRVVTMRYDENARGFVDDAVRAACEGFEVLETNEHFFMHGNVPHITLVLKLAGGGAAPWGRQQQQQGAGGKTGDDLETYLPEAHRQTYRDMRKWRNDKAKAEGKPAYTVARNTQLFQILSAMPKTLAELRAVEGVGDAFVKNYGNEVLAMVAAAPKAEQKEDDGVAAAATMED